MADREVDLSGCGHGMVVEFCEHANEHPVLTKRRCLDYGGGDSRFTAERCFVGSYFSQTPPSPTPNTDMFRSATGIRSEKCVIRQVRRCANVIDCNYTNPDSTV